MADRARYRHASGALLNHEAKSADLASASGISFASCLVSAMSRRRPEPPASWAAARLVRQAANWA
ncbi:hypothetical protein GV67_09900 [Pseudorhizobium pelagicum]|uniref:Uncharacterized protein n=1 Tax=Pseudorhizobium pelagicum TaxID=1509405 RepID=A0A922P4R9_9HYPH|nr:hypothetical protein GV67_09900 [Pseudorhizobium pelagicum]KEQ09815.1 hypothetical protein GV68_20915 [Pseudorhizobium pelagicum]